jgi:hypothetical protein
MESICLVGGKNLRFTLLSQGGLSAEQGRQILG